jgi:hypothetical protein
MRRRTEGLIEVTYSVVKGDAQQRYAQPHDDKRKQSHAAAATNAPSSASSASSASEVSSSFGRCIKESE